MSVRPEATPAEARALDVAFAVARKVLNNEDDVHATDRKSAADVLYASKALTFADPKRPLGRAIWNHGMQKGIEQGLQILDPDGIREPMSVLLAVRLHDTRPLDDRDLFRLATWIRKASGEARMLFTQEAGDHAISNVRWAAERRGWQS